LTGRLPHVLRAAGPAEITKRKVDAQCFDAEVSESVAHRIDHGAERGSGPALSHHPLVSERSGKRTVAPTTRPFRMGAAGKL